MVQGLETKEKRQEYIEDIRKRNFTSVTVTADFVVALVEAIDSEEGSEQSLIEENNQLKTQNSELQTQNNNLQTENTNLQGQVDTLTTEKTTLENRVAELEAENARLQQELDSANNGGTTA